MKRLLLVGGDKRAVCLAERLKRAGYDVETMGLSPDDLQKANIGKADAVLFPYPFSVKGGRVPSLTGVKISPEDVVGQLSKDALVIEGRGVEGYLPQGSVRVKRYTDAPLLEEKNAELSAEAAVCEAMLRCPLALKDAKVLVTGYGLFGRALAQKLKWLGADVWIAARRDSQRQQARVDGMHAVSMVEMADLLSEMNLILNTVPARIFAEYHLKQIPADCWLLELASAPYGFDMDAAKAMGVSCVLLPGLPAVYSPESAAMALCDAVIQLLDGGSV